MVDYRVDRDLLESYPTEEIQRILLEERDDYTPEALAVFEEILNKRGARVQPQEFGSSQVQSGFVSAGVMVRTPADAINVLNRILGDVMNGKMDPDVAQAATNTIMGILGAIQQDFMQGGEG
jgi:hypothetical protein